MAIDTDKQLELERLRQRIATLDEQLVDTLNDRAEVCRRVRVLTEGLSAFDTDEAPWVERLQRHSRGAMPRESLTAILREVRSAARAIEAPARVAYLGPEGGICHQMVRRHFGTVCPATACGDVAEALEEVARGRAVYAAFPIESSTEGLAQTSISALAQSELMIVGERSISARFDLVSNAADKASIREVYLTAAAHAACERYLERELPHADVHHVRSPLLAVEQVQAEGDGSRAAVVPEDCGRESGLYVTEANVGDVPEAFVRFAVAGNRPVKRSGADTTCMLFSVTDEPGSLFTVLRHFAERGLNLRKLESRPLVSADWDYVFYVEVDGHQADRAVVSALDEVRRVTRYLRVLGSYPTDVAAS